MPSYKDSLLSYDPFNYASLPAPEDWQVANKPINLWDAIALKSSQDIVNAKAEDSKRAQKEQDAMSALFKDRKASGDSTALKDTLPALQEIAAASGDLESLKTLAGIKAGTDTDQQEQDRLKIFATLSKASPDGAKDYARALGLDQKYPGLLKDKPKGDGKPKAAQPYAVIDPKDGSVSILDKADPQFASKIAGKVPYRAPQPSDPKDQAIADLLRGLTGGQAPQQGASMFGGMNPVAPQQPSGPQAGSPVPDRPGFVFTGRMIGGKPGIAPASR